MFKYLACPDCKERLKLRDKELLVCEKCRLLFKIEKGIPILLTEKAEKF
ncbi:MAG: Trm112 family protein [Candidatus Marinimicrobia bacterium]|nr:Trm112 family protein [Candidatus Neomarinimicrobiota bacterium]